MKYIPTAVTRTAARTALKINAKSPTILFGAGVVGVVATTVLACRATLKLDEVLEDAQKLLFHHDNLKKQVDSKGKRRYSDQELMKDKVEVYVQATGKIVKLYAPAFFVGAVSIACLTQSHRVLTKRNVALAGAYAGLDKAFDEYRGRVRDELGDEQDRQFLHGTTEVSEIKVGKDGKTKTVTKKVLAHGESQYARFFGEDNRNWSPHPEYNLLFLRAQQNYANDRLQARGHLFLNEVYDALGMDHTKAGSVTGWVRENGDDYVDFGVFDKKDQTKFFDFVTGQEGIWLDFNVDGVIYDKI
jgi:hypothetical protein